jgi:hypothetical protein
VVVTRPLAMSCVGGFGAGQLVDEVGEEGDVVDDGLGHAAPGVADDGSVAELEAEDDRGVDAVVEQATTTTWAAVRPSAADE